MTPTTIRRPARQKVSCGPIRWDRDPAGMLVSTRPRPTHPTTSPTVLSAAPSCFMTRGAAPWKHERPIKEAAAGSSSGTAVVRNTLPSERNCNIATEVEKRGVEDVESLQIAK
jgi:hypothetical protein